jgi:hypothetical protein
MKACLAPFSAFPEDSSNYLPHVRITSIPKTHVQHQSVGKTELANEVNNNNNNPNMASSN